MNCQDINAEQVTTTSRRERTQHASYSAAATVETRQHVGCSWRPGTPSTGEHRRMLTGGR